MARVNGSIESKISGMIGPVVFVNFNGGTYVRKAPRPRGENNWTPGQKDSRNRFSKVCTFWQKSIPIPVKQIWKLASEKMNGFNLFLKINLAAFGADGNLEDRERFHFTQGPLALPHKLRAARMKEDPGKVEISWQPDSTIGIASSKDELMWMSADVNKFAGPFETGAFRKEGSAIIPLDENPDPVTGIYLFFASKERTLYSMDQYYEV